MDGDDALELDARFETEPPQAIIRWALGSVQRIAVASAFQAEGTCVLHMATRVRPDVPVLFLDTGFHFAETLAFKERLSERLSLNIIELRGDHTPETQAIEFGVASTNGTRTCAAISTRSCRSPGPSTTTTPGSPPSGETPPRPGPVPRSSSATSSNPIG